jgi:glycine/D-amino acid oxidase-like deaminating enzyme
MRKTADATVIGGGAIATSTLYYLTKLGLRNVLLPE